MTTTLVTVGGEHKRRRRERPVCIIIIIKTPHDLRTPLSHFSTNLIRHVTISSPRIEIELQCELDDYLETHLDLSFRTESKSPPQVSFRNVSVSRL